MSIFRNMSFMAAILENRGHLGFFSDGSLSYFIEYAKSYLCAKFGAFIAK